MSRTQMLFFPLVVIAMSARVMASVTILEGPTSTAAQLGTYVKLTCRVADQGSESVRWFRIERNLVISTDTKIIKRNLRKRLRIEGDTSIGEYHLVFRQVTRDDNGTYACGVLPVATGQPIMSSGVSLLVYERPRCSVTSERPPAPGVTVTLSCNSLNQGADVSLSWHRPAQPNQVIFGTTDTHPNSNTRFSRLNITLRSSDFGESYMCKETSLAEPSFSDGCTITPMETDVPVILDPKQMQAVEGQDASFWCIIASKNSLSYEWYINGIRDYHARGDRYLISRVTLAHNNTRVECRTHDDVTSMTGNASSFLYVYPKGIPSMTTVGMVGTSDLPIVDKQQTDLPRGRLSGNTPQYVTVNSSRFMTSSSVKPTMPQGTSIKSGPTDGSPANSGILKASLPPANVAVNAIDPPLGVGSTSSNKWSNMMVPVLAVGSVIAVLLVFVIIVLLLFLVRQNRVAHGSTTEKDESRRNDIPMDELRRHGPDGASSTNRTLNSEFSEEGDGAECLGPKYFTLEPEKRKVRRLERTCSHMIMNDSSSEYNVLRRNASLRMPVQMNDYARPESQISTGDGDMSTVAAYAITDVTLGSGTSSLRRSRSCIRPLPAAPIEAIMNRSHYSIPRDAFAKTPSTTDSSGDSVTMAVVRRGMSDTLPGAYRRSQVATAYSPAGDEYAEIDSPPRAASPIGTEFSRTFQGAGLQAVKDLALSLASSYESGYDAASSDDVMDCDMSSPYATVDVYDQNEQTVAQPEINVDKTKPNNDVPPKKMPVYAKVKRTKGTQVEDKNIDDDNEIQSEVAC